MYSALYFRFVLYLRLWQTKTTKTQLIAHDKEVYDIAFAKGKDVFATVGADGSVRMFDLRCVLAVGRVVGRDVRVWKARAGSRASHTRSGR